MLTVIAYLIFDVLSIYLFSSDLEDFVPMPFLVTLTSHAVLALIVTIAGIVRAVKNRKMVIISGFFMQLWLLWMAFGVLMYIMGEPTGSLVFLILGGFIVGISYIIAILVKKQKNGDRSNWINYFVLDAVDLMEDVTADYCVRYNKKESNFTEDDYDLIYDYSSYWVLYLMVWLIKKDLYTEHFKNGIGVDTIAKVKSDIFSPKEVLEKTDYTLTNKDIRSDILQFLKSYAQASFENNYHNRYGTDYKEVIKSNQRYYYYINTPEKEDINYCQHFNINTYYELEKKINKAYHDFVQLGFCPAIKD